MEHQLQNIDPEILALMDQGINFAGFLKTPVPKEKLEKILKANDDDAATACIIETLAGFVFMGDSFCLKDVFRHFQNPEERIEQFKKSEAYSIYIKNCLFDKNDRSTIVGKGIPDFDKLLSLAAICRFVMKMRSASLDNVITRMVHLDQSEFGLHVILEGVYASIHHGNGIRMVHLPDGRVRVDVEIMESSIPSLDGQVKH